MPGKPNPLVQAALAERWPHLFTFPVPLKIRIHRDYFALSAADRPVSRKKFLRFLGRWCKQPAYLAALESAKQRYDLEGRICPLRPWE